MVAAPQFILLLNLGAGEIVLIVFVILLLFGGKGIPSVARALGKGIREFKDATSGIQKEIEETTGSITRQVNEHVQDVRRELEDGPPPPEKKS